MGVPVQRSSAVQTKDCHGPLEQPAWQFGPMTEACDMYWTTTNPGTAGSKNNIEKDLISDYVSFLKPEP